jgi:hypothetical protein
MGCATSAPEIKVWLRKHHLDVFYLLWDSPIPREHILSPFFLEL